MKFRDVSGGRSLQRPALDKDDLVEQRAAFKGEFAYEDARLNGSGQAGVTGEGLLRRCVVDGVDLSCAVLAHLDVMDVRLEGVDLSNASVGGAVKRVELLRCRGIGLRLALEHAVDMYAHDSRLDYAIIEIGRVKGLAVFDGCSLRESVISGDLSGVVFSDCDLTGAEFAANRAQDCDLRGSRLDAARGLLSLRGATISAAQALDVADALATEAGLIVDSA